MRFVSGVKAKGKFWLESRRQGLLGENNFQKQVGMCP